MFKRILQFIGIIIGCVLIVNLTKDIWRLVKAKDQIKVAEEKVKKLEEINLDLRQKQTYYSSDEFIEEEARNKLNMAKPGETIVVIPKTKEDPDKQNSEAVREDQANWEKWKNLFF